MSDYDDMTTTLPTEDEVEAHSGSRREGGRHPVNIGHLVMGLAFLGAVAVWAAVQGDLVAGDDVRWLLPLPWVVAGAAGLIALTLAGRRRRT